MSASVITSYSMENIAHQYLVTDRTFKNFSEYEQYNEVYCDLNFIHLSINVTDYGLLMFACL